MGYVRSWVGTLTEVPSVCWEQRRLHLVLPRSYRALSSHRPGMYPAARIVYPKPQIRAKSSPVGAPSYIRGCIWVLGLSPIARNGRIAVVDLAGSWRWKRGTREWTRGVRLILSEIRARTGYYPVVGPVTAGTVGTKHRSSYSLGQGTSASGRLH